MRILEKFRQAKAKRAAKKNPRNYVDCTCGERYPTGHLHAQGATRVVIVCAKPGCRNILRVTRDPVTDELNQVG